MNVEPEIAAASPFQSRREITEFLAKERESEVIRFIESPRRGPSARRRYLMEWLKEEREY